MYPLPCAGATGTDTPHAEGKIIQAETLTPADVTFAVTRANRPHCAFFSPVTKMKWIPHRSHVLGSTCFLYGIPFAWGAWPLFLLQVIPSFMSDYVKTGQDSYWHPIDRSLALFNSVLTIVSAFWVVTWWEALLLILLTFTNYFASVYFIRSRNFRNYIIAHSMCAFRQHRHLILQSSTKCYGLRR